MLFFGFCSLPFIWKSISTPLNVMYRMSVCSHSHKITVTVDFATCSFSPDKDREVVTVTIACEYLVAFLLIWREVERLPSAWCPSSMKCPLASVSAITLFSSFDLTLSISLCCVSHPLTHMTFVCFNSHRSSVRVDFAAYSLSQDTDREVVPTIPACEYFVAFLLIWRAVDRFRMNCDAFYGHSTKPSCVCMVFIFTGSRSGNGNNNTCMRVLCSLSPYLEGS